MENLDILTGKHKQKTILAKQVILQIRYADFLLILEDYRTGVKVMFDNTKKYVILTVAVCIFSAGLVLLIKQHYRDYRDYRDLSHTLHPFIFAPLSKVCSLVYLPLAYCKMCFSLFFLHFINKCGRGQYIEYGHLLDPKHVVVMRQLWFLEAFWEGSISQITHLLM